MLEDVGPEIVEAGSGEEALRRLQFDDFAVVLLDVVLPGISGFETARQIRDKFSHTPIIFLTARDVERSEMEEGYSLGAVDFLTKPVLPIVLQAKVRGFVDLFLDKQNATREAEQLRLLVEGTIDYAIFLLDTAGHVLTWNAGAERLKGYSADEIIGQHFSRFYPREAIDRDWPAHELKVALAVDRFEDEGWRIRKDGTQFWANVVITTLRDETGRHLGFSKITRDMTERKRSEENARRLAEETAARHAAEQNATLIRAEQERLQVTLASIGDAVISTDGVGRVEFLNAVAEDLIGWKTADVARRELSDIFHIVNADTRLPVENPALRALKDGTVVGLANHTILIARDGREFPIDDSAAPIRDAAGNIIGSVLVFRDISERKRAQEALLESERRFRGLMEQAPFSIQVFSPDGRTTEVNRAWQELWGLTLEQIADYNILEDPQLEAKGILSFIRQAFAGDVVAIPAIQYDPNETLPGRTRNDNPERWVSAVAYPLRDDAGRVRQVILVHQDITSRMLSDEALRDSEERLRLALEAGQMGVWDWKIQTNESNWSDTFEPLHGLPSGSFDGTFEAFKRLVHPDDWSSVRQALQRAIHECTGYDLEFRNLWPNGTVHWIAGKGQVFPGVGGQPERLIGISMDVSQRKRSEQTARFLADASASLAAVVDFESTLQKVVSLTVPQFADGAMLDLVEADGALKPVAVAHRNPEKIALAHEVHRRFALDRASAGRPWNILSTGSAELISEITDELLERSIPKKELLEGLRELGLNSCIGVPLKVRGKTLGVMTLFSTESGRRYDQADLALAQELADRGAVAIENTRLYRELKDADRRKDEFLATLAHELRNPLAPIRNALQILKMPRVDATIAQQTRDIMERQVHQLVRLVDDLLDVSRVMQGKIDLRKEPVELATVVARAVETAKPLIEAHRHHLDIAVSSESLMLQGDPVRLTQVIGNLLTNSAKYTDPNGHIWLTARREGQHAVLRIRDNGIGIAPDILPHVFDLFVQADHASTKAHGGLGIGLTLVKKLVEMHDGQVEGRSAGMGKGSEFIVRLPLLPDDAGAQDDDTHDSYPATLNSGLRVLVVDDNQDAAISLSILLRLQGHEVNVVYSGAAALEISLAFRPDAVFLDIGMPGMDGLELARRLRQLPGWENVPLIALTGWGQGEDRRRTAEAGFDRHLVKPPEPLEIERLLRELKQSPPQHAGQ
jgi:PAS domain S-box-containing protein